eukprot:Phypoly_transcript_02546.p2 GENE.Phypoly_transcript_02546~~Phypoly_transcript_02546.p2  ORF type:complete len:419 (+),score=78.63 Phypoly_transcript_02546:1446-2702(+)
MTTIKYLKAVLKYEDEDVYVELDARVLPANKDCDVSAVYTYDEWRTTRSKNGTFQKTMSSDESLYRISIIVSNIPRNSRIWFALKIVDHKYEHSFWDNNEGINYEIIPEKLPQICLPSKEADASKACRVQTSPPLAITPDSLPQTKSHKSPPRTSSRHSSPTTVRTSSPSTSRTSSPASSPPSSPLSSQQPLPPFSRSPSPPHTSATQTQRSPRKNQIPHHQPPTCTRFSNQQPTGHTQISPHAQPYVPVSPPQYQFPNYQISLPKVHQSQNFAQPQPQPQAQNKFQSNNKPQSPINSKTQPSTSRTPISPNKSSSQPQILRSGNRSSSYPSPSTPNTPQSPNKLSPTPQNQTLSLKTLTPQQLYFLQYTFPRPETRVSPPKQKPTASHVFIPSDLFPNHSICSMMQGYHRIYDEYIC